MYAQLVVSVWSVGRDTRVTLMELDERINRAVTLSWPISYDEACSFAAWANTRIEKGDCRPSMCADGWNLFIPFDQVIDADCPFTRQHKCDRRDTSRIVEYRKLADRIHSSQYAVSD